MSRLSALGVADMRAELERLVPVGQGWQPCEVDNLGHDAGRWPAAMVRPAALVRAWLAEAADTGRLTVHWNSPVHRLARTGNHWQALNTRESPIAGASVAVVAAAWGSLALLGQTDVQLHSENLPLRPVKGQMSLAAQSGLPLAARPQRDNGVFVPHYADTSLPPEWPTPIWSMGSTYERGEDNSLISETAHQRNIQSLQALCPEAALAMGSLLSEGRLQGWAEVRCASLDRVPLIGAVPDMTALQDQMSQAGARRGRVPMTEVPRCPDLYLFSALGSRGLTLSHWGAADLVRQIQGEPDTLEPDLRRALDPARFAWRQARRQPG